MRRAPFTQDQLLDRTGFPGPVTPQIPQDRVRQTYRGGPTAQAPFRSMPETGSSSLGCSDCNLSPIGMGALPAGAFAGAIGLMLAGIRNKTPYHTPGTPTQAVLDSALGKGGHPHHRGGRGGGGWWGGPVEYVDKTYVVDANPCPFGMYFDTTALRCLKVPQNVLRGLMLSGLGSTEGDICVAINALIATPRSPGAASPLNELAKRSCMGITDATAKMICTTAFTLANAGLAAGCTLVAAADARHAASTAATAQAAADAANAAAAAETMHQNILREAAAAQQQQKAFQPPTTNYVPWIIGAAAVGAAVWWFKK
jgi:hypothetical protein